MADIIRLLPDSVANQIAAGEVIQQPSSVIKELVENAADAGATEIHIVVRDAGRTLIQVTDNGKGMSPTDARMAFERHATSKIRQASDLFSLHTMGFRGEALPSICAISQVELKSAISGEPTGTKLLIDGSEVIRQEPCVCPAGTTIMVKNIFYNVPARRRFMKSDNVEMSNIIREFERLALVNHNIRFTLDTGTRRRDLRAASFKQRITDLWKGSLTPDLLPVEVDTDIVRISGFIGRPENARRRNALQFLIANGRCMQHPYFKRGIMSCYERLISAGTFPCYFLRFDVNPADIDVNIHPTKSEIKFEHEQDIHHLLTSAIQATLGKYQVVPSIDFSSDALEVQPIAKGHIPDKPASGTDPDYNPFKQGGNSSWRPSTVRRDWNELYASFSAGTDDSKASKNKTASLPLELPPSVLPEAPRMRHDSFDAPDSNADNNHSPQQAHASLAPLCLQLDNSYIVAPSREGLMLIDQHRASLSILYAQFMRRSESSDTLPLQSVLFGEELTLSPRQRAVLEEALPHLKRLGISLRRQGEAWVIASLPPTLTDHEGRDVILQTLDSLQTESDEYGHLGMQPEELRHRVALSLARSSAVKRGQALSGAEMERLLSDLLRLPNPATGPDGNRVIHLLELNKILSFF